MDARDGYNQGKVFVSGSEGPMTLTIDLPPELEQALRQYAARSGQDMSAFVLQAVQEKIAKARTFDEVCAPFARAVEAAGMTDDAFDRFFEEVREEVWQEKQDRGR
jgi:predicted transcriptional regulator